MYLYYRVIIFYKMNYEGMLDFHKAKESEPTIAVIEVPINEASRFGIMNTTNDFSIYEFEEKPEDPPNNKASMGIYIFNWKILREFLIRELKDINSSHDFGKDIIPNMFNNQFSVVCLSL